MVKAKLGLVVRIFLAAGAVAGLGGCVGEEGGFIDPYAAVGAGAKAASGFSKSPGAGAATYALGDAVSTTGQYKAAERAGEAGATNVYVGGNEPIYTSPQEQHVADEYQAQRTREAMERMKEQQRLAEEDYAQRTREAMQRQYEENRLKQQ